MRLRCSGESRRYRGENEDVALGLPKRAENGVGDLVLEAVGVATLSLANRRGLPPVDVDREQCSVARYDGHCVVVREVTAPTLGVGVADISRMR